MTDLYSTLTHRLTRGASRAILSLLGYRSEPLREHLRHLYEQRPGTAGSFLADPVFEATFGWRPAGVNMGQLAGHLLHPELVKALANPPSKLAADYAFPRKRQPYLHQLEAWHALIEATPPRSVLVSSGTGSGKTECFLIPILNDLVGEAIKQGAPLTGVRALFLYPLNALIKSQKDRLAAWSEPFKGKVRWCLYNGETPDRSPPRREREWSSEVTGRDELRANPPPILVTNATMLEYLLVRGIDRPILAQSQGQLRWIVIDEAHSYIGSQAAELTLLLRRVLHGFGCDAEQVHFVATSATIGNGEEARTQLQTFLADIAGVGIERVTVISGQREIPSLPENLLRRNVPLPDFDSLRGQSPDERFRTLGASLTVRDLRGRLVERPTRLSDLVRLADEPDNDLGRQRTLALLDLCTGAVNDDGTPLLPLRGHLFQRGQAGLWACVNTCCNGRTGTALNSPTWPFGRVYLERQEHCTDCGYPVFELVQCADCGQEVLSATLHCEDGGDWLRPETSARDEDEFQLDLEAADPDGESLLDDDDLSPGPTQGLKRLVVPAGTGDTTAGLGKDNRLDATAADAVRIALQVPNQDSHLTCPTCGAEQRGHWSQFRPARIGAPFLLQTAIPLLLEQVQPLPNRPGGQALPLKGRRLIAFTDSRQGTARIAARLQQEAERNYVRSLLYHRVATLSAQVDGGKVSEVESKIAELEGLPNNPVIAGILADYRAKLALLQDPKPASLNWPDAVSYLLSLGEFNHWVVSSLRDLTFGLTDRQIAELCLWREFLFRPKRQFSLEGLGLLRLDYPAVAQIKQVPAVLARRGVGLSDWQDLLHVVLDVQIRGWMAVNIPRDMLRWIGYPGKPTVMVPPGQETANRGEKGWPTAQTATGRRSRLVRLLAYALKLDLEDAGGRSEIEEVILAVWSALLPLLTPGESGRRNLDLPARVEITEVHDAWICPVTRRLLPVTFRGITPYLPEHPSDTLARCQKVQMPKLPTPFWDGDPAQAEHWLTTESRGRRVTPGRRMDGHQ